MGVEQFSLCLREQAGVRGNVAMNTHEKLSFAVSIRLMKTSSSPDGFCFQW
jgi:hypothetical protein